MIVESGNPAHSLADTTRMREALSALDLLVVIDVAMTETARLADYVLPVATQFEKAEATFFNFEFPKNYFHLRHPLFEPPDGLFSEAELHARLVEALGAMPEPAVKALREAWDEGRPAFRARFFEFLQGEPGFFPMAPVVLYRAIGDKLPHGLKEGAVVWALAQIAAQRIPDSVRRAGFDVDAAELGDALFDAILESPRGMIFAVDDWEEGWKRVGTPDGRIQLALPDLLEELDTLDAEPASATSSEFPFVLSAGERRSFTANTIFRTPEWRKKDPRGALRISPDDAERLGLANGGAVRVTTKRGSAVTVAEVSDRMQPGHVSLPNGMGVDFTSAEGGLERAGAAPNELTASEDRDRFAGTPWHKHVAARVEAVA
jgi:anaerobic selenocysteine-containing dehydrogenase